MCRTGRYVLLLFEPRRHRCRWLRVQSCGKEVGISHSGAWAPRCRIGQTRRPLAEGRVGGRDGDGCMAQLGSESLGVNPAGWPGSRDPRHRLERFGGASSHWMSLDTHTVNRREGVLTDRPASRCSTPRDILPTPSSSSNGPIRQLSGIWGMAYGAGN